MITVVTQRSRSLGREQKYSELAKNVKMQNDVFYVKTNSEVV